jgi:elongator complex protein 1
MFGPTKNLTVLTCESSLIDLSDFSSFKIAKHPGTLGNILAAAINGELKLFDMKEDREIPSEFLHSDFDQVNDTSICIKSFNIIEGDWLVILTLSDGRIYRSNVDEFSVDSFTFEQVGAVEGGLSAAEWSPDFNILVLITSLNRRILLSRDFEPIEEGPVQVEDFGSEEMISIGWGKKETQFHGTLGKSAAISVAQIKMERVEGDEGDARISWRADGNYFAISTLDTDAGRRIRVYDRTGNLLSTSEPIEGLESSLTWRPNGSIIASTQFLKAQNKRQVVFFERNGLRHGEFILQPHKDVKDLYWSSDSNVLAVVYKSEEVELWCSSNYHWYLKTRLPIGKVKCVSWDPEKLILTAVTDRSHVFTLVWDETTCGSCFAVVDGNSLHLTPLNICNIPPPMSLLQLTFSNVPDAVTLKSTGQNCFKVVVALPGVIEIYSVSLSAKRSAFTFELLKSFEIEDRLIQIESCVDGFMATNLEGTEVFLLSNAAATSEDVIKTFLPAKCFRISPNCGRIILIDLTVHEVIDGILNFCAVLGNKGEWISFLEAENVHLIMNEKGWLWANDNLIMTQATSFAVIEQFVLITTHTHQLVFLPRGKNNVENWESLSRAAFEGKNGNEEIQRRVERGALLVLAVPETSGVVLQMPRGNLETINPRAMVLASLRQHLNALEYRAAYALCRRHRIDLNILHDHAPELFIQTIGKFVKDLESADYLNIFLSSLRDEDVSKTKYAGFSNNNNNLVLGGFVEKINSVSEAILKVLKEDSLSWIDSIMTVYVVQQPPRLEDALNCVVELAQSGRNSEIIEKSMKYLLFLVPAEKLFDVALGMYQLPLALSIGRRSQKDPKDFEPFLEELASLSELNRKYKINDHLQRYSIALECLYQDSRVGLEEFLNYMKKYQLYKEAVAISADGKKEGLYKQVLESFGDYLMTTGDQESAVCCYKRSGNWAKLVDASIAAGCWMEFAEGFKRQTKEIDESKASALISTLKGQGRAQEAVKFCRFSGLPAYKLAIETGLFAEAASIQPELDEAFFEALNLSGKKLKARLEELSSDLAGKTERILRIQRSFLSGPPKSIDHSSGGSDAMISDNVSEMSFRTSNTTIKTRTTNASRKSTTSTKKTERNRTRDRPGSPHEREFLLFNIRDLISQIHQLAPEVKENLKNLIEFNDERDAAMNLPREISNLYKKLCSSVSSFTEEFRKIQVPLISCFNGNGQAVNEQGTLIENPMVDPLNAKFELLPNFGLPATWSIKLF